MMTNRFHTTLAAALALAFSAPLSAADFPPLEVVAVDPLIKIFRDDDVAGTPAAHADAARGEHATYQVVVKGLPIDLKNLHCETTPFVAQDDADEIHPDAAIEPGKVRFVDYIGSSISATVTTPSQQLRPAPAMYPDILRPAEHVDVQSGTNQAIWITVPVGLETEPGDYIATSTVTARMFGVETSVSVPLTLRVYPAKIEETRLNATLWYQAWHHDGWTIPPRYSDEYVEVIRGYIRNMQEHRVNWAWLETQNSMIFSEDAAGKLQVDFTNFDKMMTMFFEEGVKKVEGQHFAFRTQGWHSDFGVQVYRNHNGTWKPTKVAADSEEAERFFSVYFPALESHLEEKGWLDRYMQHVGDEPLDRNVDSYTTAAALLKRYAPRIPIMEACQTEKMIGTVNTWIPQLDHFHKGYDFFKDRIADGDDVWFYTCMYPQGDYPNRFLEQPLIQTRLLHWMNYRYGATGYLHWGYNYWTPYPWENAADYRMMQLPGGDAHIVYPAPGGPGVWDSIRFEAMRDGIEDHELLSQLGEKNPEAAMEFAKRHILDFDKVDIDVEKFRATRRELLELLR